MPIKNKGKIKIIQLGHDVEINAQVDAKELIFRPMRSASVVVPETIAPLPAEVIIRFTDLTAMSTLISSVLYLFARVVGASTEEIAALAENNDVFMPLALSQLVLEKTIAATTAGETE